MLLPNSSLFKFKSVGFTLIELLVTISIIAILTLIAIPSYDNLTKNARDGQRKSDLKTIQSALEQYYRDNTVYPTAPLPAPSWPPYLKQVPTEAVDSTHSYSYIPSATRSSYCLFAKMENASNASLTAGCSSGDYDYSVSSP